MFVKDIYSSKVFSVSPESTLREAVEVMVKNNTNTLVVINNDDTLAGIVTSKEVILAILPDFLEDVSIANLAKDDTFETFAKEKEGLLVKDFMNSKLKPVTLDMSVTQIAAHVLNQNESRLPVVDAENKVLGIVTRTHIKNAVAKVLKIQ